MGKETAMDVRSELRDYLSRHAFSGPPEALADDDDLLERGLDSMRIMQLILFAEKSFGVRLPDQEVVPENVRTIECLSRWIESHRLG
jgi:acyl carrier protein